MTRVPHALAVLAIAVGAAGCGSDDDTTSTAASTATTTATTPTTSDAPATTGTATTATPGTEATTAADPATTVAGGTDGAGGTGATAAYAAAYERECKTLVTTLSDYRQTFSGTPKGSEASVISTYKTETTRLLTTMKTMFRTLGALDAPAEYAEFQRSIAAVVPQVDLKVDRAIRVVARIRSAKQAPTAGEDVKRALGSISSDAFPASLRSQAPSCQAFGSGTGAPSAATPG